MSKILVNLAIGAAVGAVAGVLIDKAQERTAMGKPAIPTAVLASVSGLLPVGKGLALIAVAKIDELMMAGQEPGDDEASDETTDETTAGALSSPPPADQHPAGPQFAPTPA